MPSLTCVTNCGALAASAGGGQQVYCRAAPRLALQPYQTSEGSIPVSQRSPPKTSYNVLGPPKLLGPLLACSQTCTHERVPAFPDTEIVPPDPAPSCILQTILHQNWSADMASGSRANCSAVAVSQRVFQQISYNAGSYMVPMPYTTSADPAPGLQWMPPLGPTSTAAPSPLDNRPRRPSPHLHLEPNTKLPRHRQLCLRLAPPFGHQELYEASTCSSPSPQQACLVPNPAHKPLCTVLSMAFVLSCQALVTATYLVGAAQVCHRHVAWHIPSILYRLCSRTLFPPCSLRRYQNKVRCMTLMHLGLAALASIHAFQPETSLSQAALATFTAALALCNCKLLTPLYRQGKLGKQLDHCLSGLHPTRCCSTIGALLTYTLLDDMSLSVILVCLSVLCPPPPKEVIVRRGVTLISLERKGDEWPKYFVTHTHRRLTYTLRQKATIPDVLDNIRRFLSRRSSACRNPQENEPVTPQQPKPHLHRPAAETCRSQTTRAQTPTPQHTSSNQSPKHRRPHSSSRRRMCRRSIWRHRRTRHHLPARKAAVSPKCMQSIPTSATHRACPLHRGDRVLYRTRRNHWCPTRIVAVNHTPNPPTYFIRLPSGTRETNAQHLQCFHNPGYPFNTGDSILYRTRGKRWVPALIIAVDRTLQPPAYTIQLPTGERETEAHRLQPLHAPNTGPPADTSPHSTFPLCTTTSVSQSQSPLPDGRAGENPAQICHRSAAYQLGGGPKPQTKRHRESPPREPRATEQPAPPPPPCTTVDNDRHHYQRIGNDVWYVEEQTAGNCAVHAMNNALGRRVMSSLALMEFCNERFPYDRNHDFRNDGWFSIHPVFNYLAHYSPTRLVNRELSALCTQGFWPRAPPHDNGQLGQPQRLPTRPLDARTLTQLLDANDQSQAERLIVHTQNGPHYVALRRHSPSDTWYVLESLRGGSCYPLSGNPIPRVDCVNILCWAEGDSSHAVTSANAHSIADINTLRPIAQSSHSRQGRRRPPINCNPPPPRQISTTVGNTPPSSITIDLHEEEARYTPSAAPTTPATAPALEHEVRTEQGAHANNLPSQTASPPPHRHSEPSAAPRPAAPRRLPTRARQRKQPTKAAPGQTTISQRTLRPRPSGLSLIDDLSPEVNRILDAPPPSSLQECYTAALLERTPYQQGPAKAPKLDDNSQETLDTFLTNENPHRYTTAQAGPPPSVPPTSSQLAATPPVAGDSVTASAFTPGEPPSPPSTTVGPDPQNVPAPPNDPPPSLKVLCINVRGLLPKQDDIQDLVADQRPDILALTEIRVNDTQRQRTRAKFAPKHYHKFLSLPPASKHPQAGVLLAIRSELLHSGVRVEHHAIPRTLQGYLCHVTLHTPGKPLHLIGTYIPPDQPSIRTSVYSYLKSTLKKAEPEPSAAQPCSAIWMGDWNAALDPTHRSSGSLTSSDRAHLAFQSNMPLLPICNPAPESSQLPSSPQPTFMTRDSFSCIDEIFLLPKPDLKAQQPSAIVAPVDFDTDHLLVGASIPRGLFPLPVPPPLAQDPPPGAQAKRILRSPFRPRDLALFKDQVASQHASQTALLREKLEVALKQQGLDPHQPHLRPKEWRPQPSHLPQSRVDSLADDLRSLLVSIHGTALDTMGTEIRRTKENRSYSPRRIARPLRKVRDKIHSLNKLFFRLHKKQNISDWAATQEHLPSSVKAAAQEIPPPGTPNRQSAITSLSKDARDALLESQAALRDLRKEQRKARWCTYTKKLRTLFYKAPKRLHRTVFNPSSAPSLTAVHHPADPRTLTFDPQHIVQHVHQFFHRAWGTPSGAAAGAPPPWAPQSTTQSTSLDPIEIEYPRPCHMKTLWSIFARPATFKRCLKSAGNNKAPGPDGIPNEVLKHLPEPTLTTIRLFLLVLWCAGRTPTMWKVSETILLYKKDDPHSAANYRPIGLTNAIYKLWTAMITKTLQTFAQRNGILSELQEGFRPGKGTARQAHRLKLLLHDAQLSGQDIFLTYIDFSSAFNTISHAHLRTILEWMHYPQDAIRAVMSVYDQAQTTVSTRAGRTPPIHVQRGTIQGDTLSPLIFLIVLDPLLRWLQAGGRGYAPKHTDNSSRPFTISSLAYADDLVTPTSSPHDTHIQLQKLSRFCQWAGLEVNVRKCAITGALHRSCPSYAPAQAFSLQRLNTILGTSARYRDEQLPVLDPKVPFTYLGIRLSANLDPAPQLARALDKLKTRIPLLLRAPLPGQMKLQILSRCIIPSATYGLELFSYPPTHLAKVDKAVLGAVRKIFGLPPGAPGAPLCIPQSMLGLGVDVPSRRYANSLINLLVNSLNSPDTLGLMSRGQLAHQCALTQNVGPSNESPEFRAFAPYSLLTTLATMTQFNLTLDVAADNNRRPITVDHTTLSTLADTLTQHINSNVVTPPQTFAAYKARIYRSLLTLRTAGLTRLGQLLADGHSTPHLKSVQKFTNFCRSLDLPRGLPLSSLQAAYATMCKAVLGHSLTDRLPPGDIPLPVDMPALPREFSLIRPHTGPMDRFVVPRPPGIQADRGPRQRTRPPHPPLQCMDPRPTKRPRLSTKAGQAMHRARLEQEMEANQTPVIAHSAIQELTARLTLPDGSFPPGARLFLWPEHHQIKQVLSLRHWRPNPDEPPVIHFLVEWDTLYCPTALLDIYCEHWTAWHYRILRTHPSQPEELEQAGFPPPTNALMAQFLTTITFSPTWNNAHALFPNNPYAINKHIEEYLEKAAASRHASPLFCPKPKDTHLPPNQRIQPLPPRHPQPELSFLADPLDFIHIHTADHWPGLDRPATGQCALYQHDEETLLVCDMDGHPLGSLTPAHHLTLLSRHCPPDQNLPNTTEPANARPANPAPESRLPNLFLQDVLDLMARYSPQRLARHHKPSPSTHNLNASLLEALHTHLGLQTIHLTSPLNHLPPTCAYTSAFPEDSAFGHSCPTYAHPWTDTCLATPSPRREDVMKALRWAVASCRHSANAVIYIAIPADFPCNVMLPPCDVTIQHLAFIPSRFYPYVDLPHGPLKLQRTSDALPPATCTLVRLTASTSNLPPAEEVRSVIATALHPHSRYQRPQFESKYLEPRPIDHNTISLCVSAASPAPFPSTTAPSPPPHSASTILPTVPTDPPLDYAPFGSIMYTDGSRKESQETGTMRSGACVFAEAEDRRYLIHPGSNTGFHATVNRAELAAIHTTFSHIADLDQPVILFSDSLTSLQQIETRLDQMQSDQTLFSPHPESPLIQAIVELLLTRAANQIHTHLCKVPAHVGIKGNEEADAGANEACDIPEPDFTCVVGQDHRPGRYWILHQPPPTPDNLDPPPQHCRNLHDELARIIRTSKPAATCNITLYGKLLLDAKEDRLLAESLFDDDSLTFAELKTVLKVRSGQVFTMKQAKRFKLIPETAPTTCPLPGCNENDGGGHILGGCLHPRMRALIIERHNVLLRMCLEAARNGALSGRYMIVDAGSDDKISACTGGSHLPRLLPPWVCENPSRIDLVIFPEITERVGQDYETSPPSYPPVGVCRVFELGCGQDTDLENKRQEKAAQHETTYKELERRGWTVDRHVITLGHTGALPNNLYKTFEALGVSRGHQCRKLAKRMQRELVRFAHKLVVLRRQLERELGVGAFAGGAHARGRPPEKG